MTTYRLFPSTSGPSTANSYSGPFLAGVCFSVTGQVMWFEGYWWWVCGTGQSTSVQKFALWNHWASSSNTLITGSVVTSGALTAGQWNYVPLGTPLQLAPGTQYVACTGFSNSFPVTNNQFGSGQPFAAGIVNGPLTAWSDSTNGGTNNYPGTYAMAQGLFSASLGTDPSVNPPNAGSNSANFWMDLSVSDTAPGGYAGSYRLWPNMSDALGQVPDTATNFTLGMEFSLSQACTINNVWFYSASGQTKLPTEIGVYQVSGTSLAASSSSPSWSGAAGSGWVSAALTGTLSAGTSYKVVVLNGAGSPSIWNVSTADYWTTGFGTAGLASGPVTAPDNASADSPGQDTYNAGATITYPNTNAGPFNYWVDIEVTPSSPPSPPPPPAVYSMRFMP